MPLVTKPKKQAVEEAAESEEDEMMDNGEEEDAQVAASIKKSIVKPTQEQPKIKKIVAVDVPIQTARAYQFPDGTVVSGEDLLCWIANIVYEMRRIVG